MHLRNNNDDFERRIRVNGHARIFRTITDEEDPEYRRNQGEVEDIYSWIRDQYISCRGAELPGMVNPTVLENLFR
jgi:hypothetical protein